MAADALVAEYHVEEEDVHDGYFKSEVDPRHTQHEDRDEEGPAADIEAENVGIFISGLLS